MNNSIRKRTTVFVLSIVAIFIVVVIILVNLLTENQKKEIVTNECIAICESFRLEGVKINITGKSGSYGWYYTSIDSTNFDDLSPQSMFQLDNALDDVDNLFVNDYTTNGDKYEIFASSLSIYKNGSEIYNDYWNSDTHKTAQKNENTDTIGTVVNDNDIKINAWVCAQNYVESQLKYPETADFCSITEVTVYSIENEKYLVCGTVDADNAFAVPSIITFKVNLILTQDGYKDASWTYTD